MLSIIILQEGNRTETDLTLKSIREAGAARELTIIGGAADTVKVNERAIARSGSLGHDLVAAASASAGDKLLVISSGLGLGNGEIADLIQAADAQNSTFAYPVMHIEGEFVEISDHESSSLPQIISSGEKLPFGIALVQRSFAIRQSGIEGSSLLSLLAQYFVLAVANDEVVEQLPVSIGLAQPAAELLQMEPRDRAHALKLTIDNCNIENLFPQHAWNVHNEESAAASYHALAAIFIKLGDFESALACLNLSDKLEDSPRSLALKAMIAFNQGEVLIAVANLVSSLQQYEMRKKSSSSHYLTFSPSDLNEINTRLCQGLEALNRRENKDALDHFAEAVFNFDSFYREFGLDKIR